MTAGGWEIYGELYGTAAMREIFSARRRLRAMLDVEVALARAQARLGIIPAAAADAIAAAADVDRLDVAAIAARTNVVGYPVVPLTAQLARLAGADAGRYVHWGATTQDILDTATVLQLGDALSLIEADVRGIVDALAQRARVHRDDVMAGRTHLQHALPITFGYACALWLQPLVAHLDRLRDVREQVRTVQFGGAVGTLASLGARGRDVTTALAGELDLRIPDAPWHADRSAFAGVACALALLCGSLAKFATDVALLMQTEVAEVFEPHEPGRGGSSAMPQKRNPIASEYVLAATRGVHALVPVMLAAMAGDHQRSTGPWQSEEIALPQICVLASAACAHALQIARGMTVDTARMRRNVDASGGLIVAETVATALAPSLGQERAHAAVERAASAARESHRAFSDVLAETPEIAERFDRAALAELLDPARSTGEAGAVIDRILARVPAHSTRNEGSP
ncbi:MAG: 3-carboxy-cis,cis-muconate cycloisomerase [Candidatus Eremiobacteraeota bacterium]|nr:3-carboxy-cis,cis-muconate cycloisomerase [Candidatus Eremiobacteraeota bacterium]